MVQMTPVSYRQSREGAMPGEEITTLPASMSSIPSLQGTACLPEQSTGCWDSWGSGLDLEQGSLVLPASVQVLSEHHPASALHPQVKIRMT